MLRDVSSDEPELVHDKICFRGGLGRLCHDESRWVLVVTHGPWPELKGDLELMGDLM